MTKLRPTQHVAILTGIAGVALLAAGWLTWLRTDVETGGTTTISGWGSIGGPTESAGTNLNDMLSIGGLGSYRPALIGLVFGAVAILVALGLSVVRRPAVSSLRVTGALVALAAVAGIGWGGFRWLSPGTAGVLLPGEAAASWGPIVTCVAGVVLAVSAFLLLSGRVDPPDPVRHSGIQR